MLKARIITALFLTTLFISVIFFANTLWFAVFFALLTAMAGWEWASLIKLNDKTKYIYIILLLSALFVIYALNTPVLYNSAVLIGVVYALIAIVVVVFHQVGKSVLPRNQITLMLIGFLLLIPMWSSLVVLKSTAQTGSVLVLLLMLLIWSADTAAYFVGRQWGRRKLAVNISPGKTWLGAIASIITSIVIAETYVIVSEKDLNDGLVIIGISVITVISSIFGDLMESTIKRQAGQKDSGHILPGHGGVLDRIDSLTLSAPIFLFSLSSTGLLQ